MAKLSGKLTAKTLGWDRIAIGSETKKVPAEGGRVLLGRIVGIVNGLKQTVNADTGEIQNGLKGQFRGISSRNEKGEIVGIDGGVKVTAGVCYLPGGIQDMIEGTLAVAKEADAKATVQFAIDLFAIPATNKAGYSFDADTLVQAEESDPLDTLLASAANSAPALAAPETPATEEPAPAAEKPAAKKGA
jgi:hypothetical protein